MSWPLKPELALDDDEGDAVDEADDVGPAGLVAGGAGDLKFGRDVEGVVARVLPVDEAQGVSLGLALDVLVDALAESEEVVNLLARAAEPVVYGHVAQRFDGAGYAAIIERQFAPLGTDAVEALELRREHILQEHAPHLASPLDRHLLRTQIDCPNFVPRRVERIHFKRVLDARGTDDFEICNLGHGFRFNALFVRGGHFSP